MVNIGDKRSYSYGLLFTILRVPVFDIKQFKSFLRDIVLDHVFLARYMVVHP
jgi:hypothetical protein